MDTKDEWISRRMSIHVRRRVDPGVAASTAGRDARTRRLRISMAVVGSLVVIYSLARLPTKKGYNTAAGLHA